MSKLHVFNSVTLDGYFAGENGDLGWAHHPEKDEEFDAFVKDNAGGGGILVFGRITYELMASYWPTPQASQNDPAVAKGMNANQKIVFSRTLDKVTWSNTTLLKGDLTLILAARKLSRATMRNIRQNLFFAFAYNTLGVARARLRCQ